MKITKTSELKGLKNLVSEAVPSLITLIDPMVFQSPEAFISALTGLARSFAVSRAKIIAQEIADDRNKIDTDELSSDRATARLISLVKLTSDETPEPELLRAASNLFRSALEKGIDESERLNRYEMLDICKHLSGIEIRIIAACHHLLSIEATGVSVTAWANSISKELKLASPEIVIRYEENLTRQKLIAEREYMRGDKLDSWSGAGSTGGHRLTSLGKKFAELLNRM